MIDLRVLAIVLFFPTILGVGLAYFKEGKTKDYGLALHSTAISIMVSVTPRASLISQDMFLNHVVVLVLIFAFIFLTGGAYKRESQNAEKICFWLGLVSLIVAAGWAYNILNLPFPAG